MPTPDLEAIAEAVRTAWADTPPPEVIAPHLCDECQDITEALQGRPPDTVLEAVPGAVWDLPLLSDEAKRYYLPGWLLPSLEDPRSDATGALLFALDSDHRWEPEGGYTEAQRTTIARYLEAMIDHVDEYESHELQRALERWAGWPTPEA
ncbi:MAG: DUF6714 family protein [Dehalococcoidia bacterium]